MGENIIRNLRTQQQNLAQFDKQVDFGDGPRTGDSSTNSYATRFSAKGALLHAQVFGDINPVTVTAVALTSSGDAVVAGLFEGTVNLGGGMVQSKGGSDVF